MTAGLHRHISFFTVKKKKKKKKIFIQKGVAQKLVIRISVAATNKKALGEGGENDCGGGMKML